ncbi:LysM peptidoglycan-binding domain-containing protein [Listeria seeligeri]|uniref:LysM peptidoglycan-binding domain-containing protein n=1 Tax=Listeria seeligeri TaxID=1640 RepID=UPI001626996C|nr:LysM peptidoglycan-binding domain-containing protein [Listeria seeligeri]MBC1745728.1 LysM peptidoglycan-binding domain-containing protein [Listeria seeligeri]
MAKKRKDKREFEEPAEYDMSSDTQDEFNNEPPMLSRSDSRRGKKKTIFKYPLLNLLIVFFLLIPIVIVIVFVTVQNMGSNEVKTETESTVNVSDNTQAKEEKAKAKKAAEEKAAAEKAAKEKKAAEEKAAAEKQEQDAAAAKKAEEAKKEQEAAEQKAAEEKAAEEKAAAEEAQKKAAGGSHTVQAGETLYGIARSAYGGAGAAAGVEKIKQANGLGSNDVPVGTVLTIPQ